MNTSNYYLSLNELDDRSYEDIEEYDDCDEGADSEDEENKKLKKKYYRNYYKTLPTDEDNTSEFNLHYFTKIKQKEFEKQQSIYNNKPMYVSPVLRTSTSSGGIATIHEEDGVDEDGNNKKKKNQYSFINRKKKSNPDLDYRLRNSVDNIYKSNKYKQKDKKYKRKTKISEYELSSYKEAPAYIVQPYIINGYRSNFNFKLCVYSLLRIHNESGNVYTHLFAALYYFYLLVNLIMGNGGERSHLKNIYDESQSFEYSLIIFYSSCIYTFLASAFFHLFNSHSRTTCCNLLRGDFSGIVILTAASYVPPIYSGMFCFPNLRFFYINTMIVLAIISSIVLLAPKLQSAQYRKPRIYLFLFLAFFGLIPSFHAITLFGFTTSIPALTGIGLYYVLLMFALLVYSLKMPEKLWPGSCDYFIQSHQLWHILIFIATLQHVNNSLYIFELASVFDCRDIY